MDEHILDDHYRVVDDIIYYYKEAIYLVSKSTLRIKILRTIHKTPIDGHLRNCQHIQDRFSWKDLEYDVMRHRRVCPTCQLHESENGDPT
jgi:hypothetical protein